MLAGRAGLAQPLVDALAHAYERWDGKGYPARLEGDAIPLAVRVAVVARDADLAVMLGDDPREWLRARRGGVRPSSSRPSSGWSRRARARGRRRVGDRAGERASSGRRRRAGRPRRRPDRVRGLRRSQVALDPRPFPQGRRARGGGGPPVRARRSERDELRRAGSSRSRTRRRRERNLGQAGTADDLGVGSGCGCTRTTERILGRCGALAPSSSRRPRTTSASTGPAITTRSRARRCQGALVSSPLRTCSPPSPPRGAPARLLGGEASRALEAEAGLDGDAVACVLAAAGRRPAPHRPAGPPS